MLHMAYAHTGLKLLLVLHLGWVFLFFFFFFPPLLALLDVALAAQQ